MPSLDGLRGLAICLVLLFHGEVILQAGGRLTHTSLPGRFLTFLLLQGWVGVDLFFVLSGFLITGILLATRDSRNYLRSFYARRFLRVFPLYYAYVFLLFARNWKGYSIADKSSVLLYYYNFRVVHLGHHLPNLSPMWSLAIEEQFYLFWPFIVLWLSKRRLTAFCLCGMAVAFGFRVWTYAHLGYAATYFSTSCRVDTLLLGALLAIVRRDAHAWKRLERVAPAVAASAAAALVMIFYSVRDNTNLLLAGPGFTVLAVFFAALMVVSLRQGSIPHRIFLMRPLRRMGKYSYGMYILHWRIFTGLSVRHLPAFLQPFFIPEAVVLTILGAFASFHLFEKHLLRLKRYFPAVDATAQVEEKAAASA